MTPEDREKEKRRLTEPGYYCGPGAQFERSRVKAVFISFEAELATLKMQLELEKEAYNLDRELFRLRAVPDWGEPGVVPVIGNKREFRWLQRYRENGEVVDERVVRVDKETIAGAFPLTIQITREDFMERMTKFAGSRFRFSGPIPLPADLMVRELP